VPQRTALSHAFGGLAAGLVGRGKFYLYYGHQQRGGAGTLFVTAPGGLVILLGFLTFTGSLMAAGKLQELKWIPTAADHLPRAERRSTSACSPWPWPWACGWC
jgi:NAD/NADP transhydrogenase beta subunit